MIHPRQHECFLMPTEAQPHPEHVECPLTDLVPVGELGSLVQEELQGWKASSSAGPVDRCGFQLKHTFTQQTSCLLTVVLSTHLAVFKPYLVLFVHRGSGLQQPLHNVHVTFK